MERIDKEQWSCELRNRVFFNGKPQLVHVYEQYTDKIVDRFIVNEKDDLANRTWQKYFTLCDTRDCYLRAF